MVLEQLLMKDLLLAQRTSKQFRAMIRTSRRLQQKLYLMSSARTPDHAVACHNQLVMPYLCLNTRFRTARCYVDGYCFDTIACRLDKILNLPPATSCARTLLRVSMRPVEKLMAVTCTMANFSVDPFKLPVCDRDLSWRQMRVHQPSTQPIIITRPSWAHDNMESGGEQRFPVGTRLDEVVD